MKYLKLTQKGYENYSGPIGSYEFVDGLSVEPVHRVDRDRLAAAFQFDEIDDDGIVMEAGVAARLLRDRAEVAEVVAPTPVSTQAELDAEHAAFLKTIARDTAGLPIYTRIQLEKIIDKGGMAALRKIAEPWNVKHRSIPDLVKLVLDAQAAHQATRTAAMQFATDSEAELATVPAKVEPVAEPVVEPTAEPVSASPVLSDVAQAAMTGDLSVALQSDPSEAPVDEDAAK